MGSNVRSYTTKQLLDRVAQLPEFKNYPSGYWLVAIRSNEDAYNVFDDKLYLFKGKESIAVWLGTTNPGSTGLKNFSTYNSTGAAILKADQIVYDSHIRGYHKGKVLSYRQNKPILYYRDRDKDKRSEENGKVYNNIIFANIHPASYIKGNRELKKYIGPWSMGCIVFARRTDFDTFMDITRKQNVLTLCILNEFDPNKPMKKTPTPKPQPAVMVVSPPDLGGQEEQDAQVDDNNEIYIPEIDDTATIQEINPDGLEDIYIDRIEDSVNDKVQELDHKINSLNNVVRDKIPEGNLNAKPVNTVIRKESPSWVTKTFLALSTLLGGGLITSSTSHTETPSNSTYVLALLVVGLLILIIGIINYRISAKESNSLNLKKLQFHSDREMDNTDLI